MNKISYQLIVVVFISVWANINCVSYGQAVSTNVASTAGSADAYFPDLETQLVSLDTVVNVALKHSPYLKADSAAIVSSNYNVTLARKTWQSYIAGFGNYAAGNQKFGVVGGTQDGNQTTNFLNGYRYGVNVSVPLSEFTTRKNRIRKALADKDAMIHKKEQTDLEMKRQVAQEYNNLIASQKVLKIKSQSLENFRVLHQLAEKQFREGTIPLEDYAYASDLVVKAETDYELAKSNFKTLYQQFEYLIGVKLTTLMRKR